MGNEQGRPGPETHRNPTAPVMGGSSGMGGKKGQKPKKLTDAQLKNRKIRLMDEEMKAKFGRGTSTVNMKVVLIGAPRTGKSSLVRHWEAIPFEPTYTPTTQLYSTHVNWASPVASHVVKLEAWDVPAQILMDSRRPSGLPSTPFPDSPSSAGSNPLGAAGDLADAGKLDPSNLYRGVCCVIVLVDPNDMTSVNFVQDVVPLVPKDTRVLVLNNFRDHLLSTAISTDSLRHICFDLGRHIHVLESSMLNGYGLADVYHFFSLLYLIEERKVYEQRLLNNAQQMADVAESVKERASTQNYDEFLKEYSDKVSLRVTHRSEKASENDRRAPDARTVVTHHSVPEEATRPRKLSEDELRDFYGDSSDGESDHIPYLDQDTGTAESLRKMAEKAKMDDEPESIPRHDHTPVERGPFVSSVDNIELGGGLDDSFFEDAEEADVMPTPTPKKKKMSKKERAEEERNLQGAREQTRRILEEVEREERRGKVEMDDDAVAPNPLFAQPEEPEFSSEEEPVELEHPIPQARSRQNSVRLPKFMDPYPDPSDGQADGTFDVMARMRQFVPEAAHPREFPAHSPRSRSPEHPQHEEVHPPLDENEISREAQEALRQATEALAVSSSRGDEHMKTERRAEDDVHLGARRVRDVDGDLVTPKYEEERGSHRSRRHRERDEPGSRRRRVPHDEEERRSHRHRRHRSRHEMD